MKIKNGFIAISIIFSFFIVFLLIIVLNITLYAENTILVNQIKYDSKLAINTDNTKKININNVAIPVLGEATINYTHQNIAQDDVIKICYSNNKKDLFNHTNDVLTENNCVPVDYNSFINGSYTLTNLLPDVFYYCQFRVNNIPYSNIHIFKTKNTAVVNSGPVNSNNIIFTVHSMDVDYVDLENINIDGHILEQFINDKKNGYFDDSYMHGRIDNRYHQLFTHQISSKISFSIDLNLPQEVDNRLVDIGCGYTFNNHVYTGTYDGELNKKSIGECVFNKPLTCNNGICDLPYTPFAAFKDAGVFNINVEDNFGNKYSFSKKYEVKPAPNSVVSGGRCIKTNRDDYMSNINSTEITNLYANKYFCNTASFAINKRNSASVSLGNDYEKILYTIIKKVPRSNNNSEDMYTGNGDYALLTNGMTEDKNLYKRKYNNNSRDGTNYYYYLYSLNGSLDKYNSLNHSGDYIFRQDFYPDGTFSAVEVSKSGNTNNGNDNAYEYISVPFAPTFRKTGYDDNGNNNNLVIQSYHSKTLIPIKSITLTATLKSDSNERNGQNVTREFEFSSASNYAFQNYRFENKINLNLDQSITNHEPLYSYSLKTPFKRNTNNEGYNNNYNNPFDYNDPYNPNYPFDYNDPYNSNYDNISLYNELYKELLGSGRTDCSNKSSADAALSCARGKITISIKLKDIFDRDIIITQ